MNEIYIFVTTAFFFWAMREIFFWTAVWQQNEYRLDRFLLYLKAKTAKKELFYSPYALAKYLLLFGFAAVIFYDKYSQIYQLLVITLYIYQAFLVLKDIYKNTLKKPFLTPRPIIIIIVALLTLAVLYAIQLMDRFFWLILLDILISPLVMFLVFICSFPVDIYTDMQIEKAAKLIEKQKKLIIIGVTGSYGKSATKDFIAEILGKKFKVLKTQGKNNTALGIANTIVKGLKNDTQVFVAEIGGYKRGEVKTVAEFIHPQIGVITGINNRYLSLFGSLENKKKANFELMQSLPKNGLAIFNGNNKDTKGLYKKTRKPKILTFTEDIQAANLIERQKTISFDVRIKNRSIHFAALHLKAQEIENLLPAIYLASYLGIKGIEIKKLVAKMRKK